MKKYLLIFALLGQYFVFGQKNFLDQAYLETSAKADSLVTPDRIYLSIHINEADSKNKKSVEQQEKELESVLKKININIQKDLVLLGLSSDFKSYFLKGQNVLKSKQYELLVRDAVTAGKVLVELERAGISNVRISKTEYSKKEELISALKAQAVAKTRKNAEMLVKPLNQKVGKAVHISDMTNSNYFYEYNTREDIALAVAITDLKMTEESPVEVDFKKMKFEAQVSVKYILE